MLPNDNKTNIHFDLPEQVNKALNILHSNGFNAHIVGGAVRDILMGKTPNDYDITTDALPSETEKAFGNAGFHYFETGIAHGTVTVIVDKMPLEITTYRIEGEYTDNRHPSSVSFTDDIELDLSRRDFTCNAMAFSPKGGLEDPFGGQYDIKNKLIRAVGEADKRFNEDALRILRALRFSAVLGFEIEKKTEESIKKNYRLLKNISRERIFEETKKLICGKNAGEILKKYFYVFFCIMPQLEKMKGCEQRHERHIYDVWEHSVKAFEESEAIPTMRFAALLHDVGKPNCKTTDDSGVNHFFGHSKISADISRDVMNSLKVSNEFKNTVISLVEHHDFCPEIMNEKTLKKYIGKFGIDMLNDFIKIRTADIKAQNPIFLSESVSAIEKGKKRLSEIYENSVCFSLKDLAINGRDLINAGINDGIEIKNTLNNLLEKVLEGKIENKKEILLSEIKTGETGND